MAKRRTTKSSSKRTTKKSSSKKRGGNWFEDLGKKIKNEFVNPSSVLRQQFYREAPLRNDILKTATSALGGVPVLGQALSLANQANDAAKMVGLGRMKKYVKYIKSKSHGKHGKRKSGK